MISNMVRHGGNHTCVACIRQRKNPGKGLIYAIRIGFACGENGVILLSTSVLCWYILRIQEQIEQQCGARVQARGVTDYPALVFGDFSEVLRPDERSRSRGFSQGSRSE